MTASEEKTTQETSRNAAAKVASGEGLGKEGGRGISGHMGARVSGVRRACGGGTSETSMLTRVL
eukprot:383746-Prorocentrum_minimum.AAC.1